MKYLFIMSTKAANGKNLPRVELIEKSLQGEDYEIYYTNYQSEPRDVAKKYAEKYGSEVAIFACGGDGTINEVATGIVGTDAYMGIVPSGTGNDFSRTIYGDKSIEEIILGIKNLKPTKIDLIKINEHYSINIASFGFDSFVTEKVVKNEGNIKKYGELAYLIAAYQCLMEQRKFPLEYEFKLANGSIAYGKGDYLLGSIANAKYYGGGFYVAPHAIPTDGRLDITIVNELSVDKIIKLMFKYRKGEHFGIDEVKTFQAKSGKIISHGSEIPANYDGEIFKFKELEFEILERKINFLA